VDKQALSRSGDTGGKKLLMSYLAALLVGGGHIGDRNGKDALIMVVQFEVSVSFYCASQCSETRGTTDSAAGTLQDVTAINDL